MLRGKTSISASHITMAVFLFCNIITIEKTDTDRLKVDYIVAKPRMAYYIKYSTDIYNVYLKYLSPEDIYVYSIDEVFCDITNYLKFNKLTPKEFITKIIKDVYETTGITATAGIGTNLYLAKVAMDIVAKHTKPNEFGVRVAVLNEMQYRKYLWKYKPITSFWRVGKGYAKKLEDNLSYTNSIVSGIPQTIVSTLTKYGIIEMINNRCGSGDNEHTKEKSLTDKIIGYLSLYIPIIQLCLLVAILILLCIILIEK